MMRAPVWLLLGCLTSACAWAGTWSNLWRTPDQQGQALLEAGHAAQAADHFADPRLKAYADLQAERYAQAAQLLAPFKDATSEYNRGNALAHTGHLRAALATYDAALKQAPRDKDIRHNRDLVARMLKRHPPKSNPQGGGAGNPQGAPSGKGANQRPSPSQNQGQNHGQGQSQSQSQSQKQGRHHGSGGDQTNPAAGGSPGSGATGANSPQNAAANGQPAGSTQGTGTTSPSNRQNARPAPPPIADSGTSQQHPGEAPDRTSASTLGGARTPPPKPVSEKTLALEQWLRQIPDNPAGLLRRKFLIEYLKRHPGENP